MGNIGSTYGNRIPNMATMNVDALRTMGTVDSLITSLQAINIDIACIQETHNNRNDHMGRVNYTICFSGEDTDDVKTTSNRPIKGGVAIDIKTQWGDDITQIKRYSSRSVGIQIKTIPKPHT